ncbi:MAG TPA: lipoate--protein ligase [Salinivirgaceae bacterium]|nr:lipoate--protein ligase [Salinivirgaceae bacterium]
MNYLRSNVFDPSVNLATEEYLLKHSSDEWCFLYVNKPSVVIGKHQNAMAEVDIISAMDHSVGVFRRISGGGAVYHDYGNLNFCFIYNREVGQQVDFQRNSRPVVEFLNSEGLDVEYAGANNLVYRGLKFSGNAEHVYKNRVMHHGTILFDSDLELLSQVLTPQKKDYQHRGVLSKPWPVVNLKSVLPEFRSIDHLADALGNFMQRTYRVNPAFLSENDQTAIEHLAEEKFRTWQWNFAYAANYNLTRTIKVNGRNLIVELEVSNGIIFRVIVNNQEAGYLEAIVGERHHPEAISQRLKLIQSENKSKFNLKDIVNQLF